MRTLVHQTCLVEMLNQLIVTCGLPVGGCRAGLKSWSQAIAHAVRTSSDCLTDFWMVHAPFYSQFREFCLVVKQKKLKNKQLFAHVEIFRFCVIFFFF